MEQDFASRLVELERELRDLKTARLLPSNMSTYTKSFTVSSNAQKGQTWTIQYKSGGVSDAPISQIMFEESASLDIWSNTFTLLEYNSSNFTQKIQMTYRTPAFVAPTLTVSSTREIVSITQD